MARTPRTLRRRAQNKPRRLRPAQDGPRELNFETDERSARIGEPTDPDVLRASLPKRREREAGITGGGVPGAPGERVTGDDLAPETMIDEDGSGGPTIYASRAPQDSVLRVVDEDEIGARGGLDEAELAQVDSIDPAELTELTAHRRKAHRATRP